MISMMKRGLILISLLLVPVFALAGEAPDGPAYLKWLQEQSAKGNPAGARSGGGGSSVQHNAAEDSFFSDGGGNFQLDYRFQADYSDMLGRLKALLTSPEWFGDCEHAQHAAAMLESGGAFNAAQYRELLTIDKDLLRYSIAQDYSGLAPDSYKGKFFAQPNLPFASANYVNSDVLLYFGMHNVPQTALLTFRELAKNPEALKEGMLGDLLDEMTDGSMEGTDLAQITAMMDAMNIEGTINNLLTGEVALAFYGINNLETAIESGPQPEDIDASVFLGVRDRAAIANMLTAYGSDMGLASSGESLGWQLYKFDGEDSITLALGPDVLLATTNWQATSSRMMMRVARLAVPAGQYNVHLNLDTLCHMLEPVALMAESELLDMDYLRGEFDEHGWPSVDKLDSGLRYLLDLDAQGGCGSLDISGYYNNGYRSELTLKPSVFMYGMYLMGRWGGLAAASQAMHEMHDGDEMQSGDVLDDPSGGGTSYNMEYFPEGEQVADISASPAPEGEGVVPGGDEDLR